MWADNETSEDLLGFKVHADLLIDVINDEAILPVTIGVFGDWGSGKSSILRIVEKELSGADKDDLKDGTLVLYFNGWVFEGYDDAKAALLESIIDKFDKHKTLGNKVKDKTTNLLKSVNWMRLLGLGFKNVVLPGAAAFISGGMSLAPYLASQFASMSGEELAQRLNGENAESFLAEIIKKNETEETMLVREFRDDFEDLINKSEIKKLVVIIDDLDRCRPERLIENLEAIKLFLNVPKTAFVIGADPRIVRHAIEHRYKTDKIEHADDPDSRNKRIVSDYLEKLIQIPYNLPKLSDTEVETYMSLLFCKNSLGDDFGKVHIAFCEHREKDRYSVYGLGNISGILTAEEKDKLGGSISLIASLSSIITEGLNGNPRQIKRFLNTFTLRKRLVEVAKFSDFRVDILAKLMVLEYAEPDLFRKLYMWQASQKGTPKEIIELEKLSTNDEKEGLRAANFADWTNDKIMKWLKVEPMLSNIDLRNYYWVSRDQLANSISGASLIPEYVRSLFKKLVDHGSATILAKTITNEVLGGINDTDLENLLLLLEREIVRKPEEESLHEIAIEFMQQSVPKSVDMYSRVINQVDHNSIPYHLNNQLKTAATKNAKIHGVMALFSKNSKIGKAIKQD